MVYSKNQTKSFNISYFSILNIINPKEDSSLHKNGALFFYQSKLAQYSLGRFNTARVNV